MAVLHALLQHEPAARAKAELQGVVAKYDPVLAVDLGVGRDKPLSDIAPVTWQ